MSEQEAIRAYADGRMSRRTLIRRLIAGGMSLGAAVSYAHLLSPERASARSLRDLHGITFSAELVEQDLDKVIKKGVVKVKATSSAATSQTLFIHLYRPASKTAYPDAVIAKGTADFGGPGTKTFKFPIAPYMAPASPNYALTALKRQKKAKLGLSFFDGDDPSPFNVAVYKR